VVLDAILARQAQVIPVLAFPTFARHDLAQRMIDSIDFPVQHLVIADNSGDFDFEPVLNDNIKNFWLWRFPHSLGPAPAMNIVIKALPYAPYWVFASEDTYLEPGALEIIYNQADPKAMSFVDAVPDWCFVVMGEDVVLKSGLQSELFYPLYFDDNDHERRIKAAGIPIKRIQAKVHHDNSSTLKSGYEHRNHFTFDLNSKLFQERAANNVMTGGEYDLAIRRRNRWD
jgi:GT2 family glycosyltransferase